ncbi:MAG: primosomal protein N', partial [Holosporales bacterium]|nr:primosomal protein N' [Holosporales bacterium]
STENLYNIAVLFNLDNLYTYRSNVLLEIGQIVTVSLRNKEVIGVVFGQGNTEFSGKIKNIISITPYGIRAEYIELAKFMKEYNLLTIGNVLKLMIPFSIDLILLSEKNICSCSQSNTDVVVLSAEQQVACKMIEQFNGKHRVILLHGVTGSGKTEVFLTLASRMIDEGKQVLILVPEIALSTDLAKKVSDRCDADVFIWHNSISSMTKLSIWKKAVNGESMIIVGARSALFIPFNNLSMIVVDEEHDHSFKQNEAPIYNARDMAVYLGFCLEIPVILSSATPSLESYKNAHDGKYEYVRLKSRYFKQACLPKVYIDDLRKKRSHGALSEFSISEITECVRAKKQALIFINRRGHTPKVFCKSCGWKANCPGCSAWLCFHSKTQEFICHYCGYRTKIIRNCPICSENNLIGIGTGIEKVLEECLELFPEAEILSLSSDTLNTPNKISKAVNKIKNHEVDLILGTQIVAKGHNFDDLDLVVIVCADAMMYGEDFRSIEKAFQMIHQVSGRAGRKDGSNSKIIIQTYDPNDGLLKVIQCGGFEEFYKNEMKNRELMAMPPFGKMVNINISALSEAEVWAFAKDMISSAPPEKQVKILGPLEPVIYKIRSRYRLRIIVLSPKRLQKYIKNWIFSRKISDNIKISIDIDPYDFW